MSRGFSHGQKAQQAYYLCGRLFASLPRVFGRSECLAVEGRNPLGALSCLSVSRSQVLGPMHLEGICQLVLERYVRFMRRARSWELHVNGETKR